MFEGVKQLKSSRNLKIKGALLDEKQLETYLEEIASEHVIQKKIRERYLSHWPFRRKFYLYYTNV